MTLLAERAVDGAGVVVPLTATGAVTVAFDGQHVWSFRPSLDGRPQRGAWFVPWPQLLRPYLEGTTRVQVVEYSTGQVYVDEEVVLGSGAGRIAVRDRAANPLAVNKAGTLSRAFLATDESARQEILTGTQRILADLHEAGAAAYLNYGALLGAVRDGRMIGHDSDLDLCYLSEHQNPVDVILESYRLERAMRARGWATKRMSGADFKVAFHLSDGRKEDVDVFVAFFVGERFFQLGNRSGRLTRNAILPLSTISLEGHDFPAPADPESMMEFLYGSGWRVPDPSFRYADPPEGVRRLDGWLRGFRTEQPRWNRWYLAHGKHVPQHGSEFASWVAARVAPDVVIADLGCGLGRDSLHFASLGHRVVSFECAPEARGRTRRRLRAAGHPDDVRRLQANELRTVLTAGTELALLDRSVVLYARQLIGCFDEQGRRNLWRLGRMLGGSMFVEFSTWDDDGEVLPAGLVTRLGSDFIVAEAAEYGARVVERLEGPGTGMFDQPDPAITRLHLSFAKETADG